MGHFKNDSEGSTNPHFKIKWNFKRDAQMTSYSRSYQTRDVTTRPHLTESRLEIQGSTERKRGTPVEDDPLAPR